jgi:hydroxymethylbilane synthase
VPVAAYAELVDGRLHLRGRVASLDGRAFVDVAGDALPEDAAALGEALAIQALSQGAARLLHEAAA